MLKTCLKYDLKALLRIWWIIAVSMLGAALLAGLGIRAFLEFTASENAGALKILGVFGMLAAMLCIIGMAGAFTGTLILVYWRMYTHFYSDQGYLTFTLPVKRSTLYLSKVLAGTVIEAATALIFVVGIAWILLIAPPAEAGQLLNAAIYTQLGFLLGLLGQGVGLWLIAWIPLVLLLLVLLQLCASGLMYLCITIGAVVAKKHKLLAGIGIYYLVNAGVSLVTQIGGIFLFSGLVEVIAAIANTGGNVVFMTITVLLGIVCLLAACVACTFHFITVGKLERQLNLA